MISELCIYDTRDDGVAVVLRHDGHIEAPNWHPDGALIVNGEGRIFRVPLDAPSLIPIDTGFATACNNDHGISPDGQTLAISDKTQTGESCIYTLPITGGTPRRVTENVPSWWHGWSPDGADMTYVGAQRRDRVVRLYTCPAGGGAEVQVTDGFDHIDGPDFTPDGHWIWFNGERSGAVNLWRIRPDGTGLTQMTSGPTIDWFPHPSPCGRHVIYIAYAPGTQGHPGGVDVALMIMSQEGGTPRHLLDIHGGQGCLNVPSWDAGGDRFAFMRYAVPETPE